MGRYTTTIPTVVTNDFDNKKRYYQSIIDPYVERKSSDIYIVTKIGDRLDSLSWKYYGNAEYWFIIAAANPNIRKDSLYLDTGIQLRIPVDYQEVITMYQSLNSSR